MNKLIVSLVLFGSLFAGHSAEAFQSYCDGLLQVSGRRVVGAAYLKHERLRPGKATGSRIANGGRYGGRYTVLNQISVGTSAWSIQEFAKYNRNTAIAESEGNFVEASLQEVPQYPRRPVLCTTY